MSVQEIMPQGAHLLHASAAHHGTGGLAMCRLGYYYCFGSRDGVMRTANVSDGDGGGGSENKLVGGRVAARDSGRPSRATAGRSRSREGLHAGFTVSKRKNFGPQRKIGNFRNFGKSSSKLNIFIFLNDTFYI